MATNSMMVVIKTLGPELDAAVIAIGVALFSPEKGEVNKGICYMPSDSKGCIVNTNTLWWWTSIAPNALMEYLELSTKMGVPMPWKGISETLEELLRNNEVDAIWTPDINFTFPVLERAFAKAGVSNPFVIKSPDDRMDVKQWKKVAAVAGWTEPARPKHLPVYDAAADATWQSSLVCNIWGFFRRNYGSVGSTQV
jgi:hypothetical protein